MVIAPATAPSTINPTLVFSEGGRRLVEGAYVGATGAIRERERCEMLDRNCSGIYAIQFLTRGKTSTAKICSRVMWDEDFPCHPKLKYASQHYFDIFLTSLGAHRRGVNSETGPSGEDRCWQGSSIGNRDRVGERGDVGLVVVDGVDEFLVRHPVTFCPSAVLTKAEEEYRPRDQRDRMLRRQPRLLPNQQTEFM